MISTRFASVKIVCATGGYFFEDLAAVRARNIPVAERYFTPTDHQRYSHVRSRTPALSMGFSLAGVAPVSDHFWGDCVPVSFSGKSGRALAWSLEESKTWVTKELEPWLRSLDSAAWIKNDEALASQFKEVPPYIRYGASQALVRVASYVRRVPIWRVIAEDLGLPFNPKKVPLHGSSGGDWDAVVDKMLVHKIPFLPQGQFENLREQIGLNGERLLAWVEEFKQKAKRNAYHPVLTLDFHGALDEIFSGDLERISSYLALLTKTASPHKLHIESPIAADDFPDFLQRMQELRLLLNKKLQGDQSFDLIADEWANSFEQIQMLCSSNAVDGVHIKMPDTGTLSESAAAVMYLKKHKKFSLLGGSCTETADSAEVSAHLGLATQPEALLVKPGMGFDESYSHMSLIMERYGCD